MDKYKETREDSEDSLCLITMQVQMLATALLFLLNNLGEKYDDPFHKAEQITEAEKSPEVK